MKYYSNIFNSLIIIIWHLIFLLLFFLFFSILFQLYSYLPFIITQKSDITDYKIGNNHSVIIKYA